MHDIKETDLDKVIKCYEGNIKALEEEILKIKKTIKSRKKDLEEYRNMKNSGKEELCKIEWRV